MHKLVIYKLCFFYIEGMGVGNDIQRKYHNMQYIN